jgi:hypothetical protein
MLKLDSKIQRAEVVHTGPELVAICAQDVTVSDEWDWAVSHRRDAASAAASHSCETGFSPM